MSYRIQITLGQRAPLKDKVLLHAKFLRHFQRRSADAVGRTKWTMEFSSEPGSFTVVWGRQPGPVGVVMKYRRERLMGLVVIKFSKKDIEVGGPYLVMGEWDQIESSMSREQRTA